MTPGSLRHALKSNFIPSRDSGLTTLLTAGYTATGSAAIALGAAVQAPEPAAAGGIFVVGCVATSLVRSIVQARREDRYDGPPYSPTP